MGNQSRAFPAPGVVIPDWGIAAECQGTDTIVFFGPTSAYGESHTTIGRDTRLYYKRLAVDICNSCNVRTECLEWSLDHPSLAEYGVWGGLDEKERKRLRRNRQAVRQRKRRRANAKN